MNSELVPYLCEQTFWYLYFKWHTLRRKRMLKIVSKTQNLLWSLHQMIHDQNCAILGMLLLLKLWGQPNQSELRFVSWPICKFGWRHLQLCTGSPKKKLLIEIKRSDIGDLDTVSAGGVYIVERIPFPNFYLPLPPPLFRCEIIWKGPAAHFDFYQELFLGLPVD